MAAETTDAEQPGEPAHKQPAHEQSALVPVLVGVLVTALAALLAYFLPVRHAATGVGFCFFIATYVLVLRRDAETIRHHGVSLGGVFEPVPLDVKRLLSDAARALAFALASAVVLFPPFWLGFVAWWRPHQAFDPSALPTFDEVLGQLLVIALPEEVFYRGYLQTALDDTWSKRVRVLGASLGPGILLSSAIFTLGHVATEFQPGRLAVFFPSLVFGWLTARTRGVGAAIVFHAACNVFSAYLARGYGFG